jgi:hypothetical protein
VAAPVATLIRFSSLELPTLQLASATTGYKLQATSLKAPSPGEWAGSPSRWRPTRRRARG